MINIVRYKAVFLTISVLLIGAAIAVSAIFGFREGIDFSGGTLWRLTIPDRSVEEVTAFIHGSLNLPNAHVNYDPTSASFLVRMPEHAGTSHEGLLSAVKANYPNAEELSFQSVGPSIGSELRQKAILAIVLVLVGISLYIAFAFRKVMRPVSSWTYGVITLITLFHDVVLPAGLLAVLGHYYGAEIDGNFVVALLVVMGFSVHDTIVVFDRIRENLFLDRGNAHFSTIVNKSVNETMARSINTSFTLILVLVALLFLGPLNLRYFILTLLVGVITGIYSSIFVASPLLLVWQKLRRKEA